MYKELKEIQKLLWKDDDRMEQETLFDLQDYVAKLILKVAKEEGQLNDLLANFRFLYTKELGGRIK